jgi:ArsR family transcriptional regulator
MQRSSLSQEITALHADICSALADSTQILILYSLFDQPRCVNDLVQELEVSQSAVSRHLKVLRERSLVNTERQGANIVYSLADQRLINALDILRAVLRDRITYRASLIDVTAENG